MIPIVDGAVGRWYKERIGAKYASSEWPLFVMALQSDLRHEQNQQTFQRVRAELQNELDHDAPSELRMLNIVLWMEDRADTYFW